MNTVYNIIMCGCHEAGYPIIKHLLENGIKFKYFLGLTPEQGTKFKISGYMDFESLAKEYNIPYRTVTKYSLTHADDIKFFKENKFDLLVQGGWQRLFPAEILTTLRIGAIGGHGSSDLLPKGRGRSPLNWSLLQDKKRFIMNLFLIKEGVDDGSIFATCDFDINRFDDIKTLYAKVSIVTKHMLLFHIPKLLNNECIFTPQSGLASYYPKRNPEDGLIDWENDDIYKICNLVRALTKPYPGAYVIEKDTIMKIWKCQVFDTRIKYIYANYGDIVERIENSLIINCRGGLLLVSEYEYEEK